ncbi:hypothetical protein, partial [Nostoc sp. LPT]|uniref:hypothetical protein n=1 Tax=Nostoc sp. LPT TaxID=2815387 RepID=UPI0025D54BF7
IAEGRINIVLGCIGIAEGCINIVLGCIGIAEGRINVDIGMHWHCKVLPNLIRYKLMKCCT